MDFPINPRDLDFTEIEDILRVHERPPFGAYIEVVMGRMLNAEFLAGWKEGAIAKS